MLSRFARDTEIPDVGEVSDNMGETVGDYAPTIWFPPKGQWGTPWVPSEASDESRLSLDHVNMLFWLFAILEIVSIFGLIMNYCGARCCAKEEVSASTAADYAAGIDSKGISAAKTKHGNTSNYTAGLITGILGQLAIVYDCKGLLMFMLIISFLTIICGAILFACTMLGMSALICALGDSSDGICSECGGIMCTFIITVLSFGFKFAFDIAVVALALPFITADDGAYPLYQ